MGSPASIVVHVFGAARAELSPADRSPNMNAEGRKRANVSFRSRMKGNEKTLAASGPRIGLRWTSLTFNHIRLRVFATRLASSGSEQKRKRAEEMSERRTSTSWTGISHSAGPAFGVEHSIRGEIPAISPFVDKLMLVIKRCRCVPGSETEVEGSCREALANAIVHANLEDPSKHVHVSCRCVPDEEVSFVVRDKGKGFNSVELPCSRRLGDRRVSFIRDDLA